MKILVACEYTATVREAFARRGHEVLSCDLRKTEVKGYHYRGDVKNVIGMNWDMIIAFPPCTHLTTACANVWAKKRELGVQQDAIDFFLMIWNAPAKKICIENPQGIMSTLLRRPDQVINPFEFGHIWKKRTHLWLKNLPPLLPTKVIYPRNAWSSGSYFNGRCGRHTSSLHRSRTFPGIAEAMASQWGKE